MQIIRLKKCNITGKLNDDRMLLNLWIKANYITNKVNGGSTDVQNTAFVHAVKNLTCWMVDKTMADSSLLWI